MDHMVTTDRLGGQVMEDGDTMQNLARSLILMACEQKNKLFYYIAYITVYIYNALTIMTSLMEQNSAQP